MKRIAILILAALLLLSGCAEQTPAALLKSGKLRAAITSELENSQEIAEYIAEKMNAPLEISRTDRETALEMLANGSADIAVGGFSETNDPGLNFLMTLPVAENKVYIVCGGNLSATSIVDLTGRVCGASAELSESVLRGLLTVAADGTLVCNNAKSAAEMLAAGDIDAYVCFEDEALELLSGNKKLRCCIPADIEPERYSVLVQKNKTELFGAVNGIVGEMITGEK